MRSVTPQRRLMKSTRRTVLGAAAALPASVPLQLIPSRFVFTFAGLLVAAGLGSVISLRRVIRIDPASAIGNAS